MPYEKVSLGGGKFKVVNKESGNVHSKSTSSANADKQIRLLHGVEHGMVPRTTRKTMGSRPTAGSRSRSSSSGHKSAHGKRKHRR